MAKSDKAERREAVDQIRRQQQRADQRQGRIIIGACAALALSLVAIVAYPILKSMWDERQYADKELSEIGEPASACQPIITKKATGEQSHVEPGTPVDYQEAPPAFGSHEDQPEQIEGKFYDEDDRPSIERLVHNLEHGYTVLWYDESIADDDDQISMLRAVGRKLGSTTDFRDKFKIAPWTSEDGEAFPDGQHIALTHWAVESKEEGDKEGQQYGIWQYCSDVSGEAVEDFMSKYDYTNSPEPVGG